LVPWLWWSYRALAQCCELSMSCYWSCNTCSWHKLTLLNLPPVNESIFTVVSNVKVQHNAVLPGKWYYAIKFFKYFFAKFCTFVQIYFIASSSLNTVLPRTSESSDLIALYRCTLLTYSLLSITKWNADDWLWLFHYFLDNRKEIYQQNIIFSSTNIHI